MAVQRWYFFILNDTGVVFLAVGRLLSVYLFFCCYSYVVERFPFIYISVNRYAMYFTKIIIGVLFIKGDLSSSIRIQYFGSESEHQFYLFICILLIQPFSSILLNNKLTSSLFIQAFDKFSYICVYGFIT